MRLLFLSSFYPPFEIGGMEQLCEEVAAGLQSRGHRVLVLTSRYGSGGEDNCPDMVMRSLHLQADVDYYRPWEFFFLRPIRERASSAALRKIMGSYDPELVVVFNMWNLAHSLPRVAEQSIPGGVAYYIASTWPVDPDIHEQYWCLQAKHRWSEFLKKPLRALAMAQLRREGYPAKLRLEHAMCCSHYIRNLLMEAGKLGSDSGVIYNGIDPGPFLRSSTIGEPGEHGRCRLIYFGTLVRQKGVHTAVEALGRLRQRNLLDRVELNILGDGHPDYVAELHRMATDLGVHECIQFAGRVPRHEIPARLACSDVFLFTSSGPEAMARTVMEAMAAGLLVIGTEAGGQGEMLKHGENSLTFRAEDSETLADRIERVVEDPVLMERLAQNGKQMVLEQFTLERMICEIETWLKSIVR